MSSSRFASRMLAVALLLAAVPAMAATPAQTCRSGKNKAAGKYDYCRQKAEAKFATSNDDGTLRAASLQKCLDKYDETWPKLEAKAVAAGSACPSVGDQATIQGAIDAVTTSVATALAGGALPNCPGDLASCQADLTTCTADLATCQSAEQLFPATGQTTCWDNAGAVIACAATGQDGEMRAGSPLAYTDNGDGTITDDNTRLMWEKLADDGSVHDWDDRYTWDAAFGKVAALNAASFAGHTDWRLPNVKELESIVDFDFTTPGPAVSPAFNTGCTPGCTVTTCSCTMSGNILILDLYATSSTFATDPVGSWNVSFSGGVTFPITKTNANFVRAVRGG